MTTRRPTEELEQEHRVIQQVVGAMAVLIEKLESGKEVDPSVFTDLSEFLQTFGDKCHHAKEEEYLFKLLEKKGVPVSGCPLAVLLHEHEKGRSLMADLKLTSATYVRTPNAGKEALIGTLRRLIELYPAHIWKEDYLLFPMAEKLLSESEQKELSAQFAEHEAGIGVDVHHGFEQLAGRILEMICGEAATCHAA
ncbi:MAG: hemerythrin domain-containing protein [Acidobacteriia bacterium]|nr:hemerythrin domain-containing protein [Terriglobia bacterium]